MPQVKTKRTKKRKKRKTRKVYSNADFKSKDGMLTTVWGPPMWHFLHTISFNYPEYPTKQQKKNYRNFILSLENILPCRHCRDNLKKNLKKIPLTMKNMKNRHTFSLWMYNLHEIVNKMLHKTSGLTYEAVRERYEHFRSRCTEDKKKRLSRKKVCRCKRKTRKKKESGCTKPLYGKKSKCILKIIPHDRKVKSLQIDKRCIKTR
jgi:hypothetical protein